MADPQTESRSTGAPGSRTINDRVWDVLVFAPVGAVISVAEELPRLAAKGRAHFEVRVSSARAVGQYAVRTGGKELRRRSGALLGGRPGTVSGPVRSGPRTPPAQRVPGAATSSTGTAARHGGGAEGNGHVPSSSALAIPGFDALSASQVVQRLDGLSRSELVSVRAYEAATRGRRTILNRVDQLLDERS